MSESINKIKVKDITYDVEDSVARAGLDKVLLFESITWAELKSLKDNGNLAPGTKYRITDYITTTTQENTRSAGNQFDIIVEALTEDSLNELASACLHEGDTYFSSQGCNLEAWQLWYSLDNDTDKYAWADTENGKGVIYRMIDEKNNDCPYDFKNILFYTTSNTINTTSDNYYYTFSYVISGVLYDGTTEKRVIGCHNNNIRVYYTSGKSILNGNIFTNSSFRYNCLYNTFGNNCQYNTFGDNCYNNTFGNNCQNNTFVFNCDNNKFGYNCQYNTFGDNCYNNKFESGTSDRVLYINNTSITLNEEYYDDGTNALVPIKHPDLSTQPNILPYKFMGNYVYEQLIPIDSLELRGGSLAIPKSLFLYNNVLVLGCDFIGSGAYKSGTFYTGDFANDIYLAEVSSSSGAHDAYKYIKIVYTLMPEEGGYYYNSATLKGILVKFNGLDATPGSLYDGSTLIEPVALDQGYHYDIPNDYGSSTSYNGFSISPSFGESITVQYSIPDIGETGTLEHGIIDNPSYVPLPGELVDKAKQYLVIITIENI